MNVPRETLGNSLNRGVSFETLALDAKTVFHVKRSRSPKKHTLREAFFAKSFNAMFHVKHLRSALWLCFM